MNLAGALDVGGTKTIVALVDKMGAIISMEQFKTDVQDMYGHFSRCADALNELAQGQNLSTKGLTGIGINMPGMVNSKTGYLDNAPFAGWKNVDVRSYFSHRLENPNIYVENDVNACAIGELLFGHKERYSSFVWVTLSTGIGGAVVVNGKPVPGQLNRAGEIGHFKVEFNNPASCSCGQMGCLEAHASGTAITRMIRENGPLMQKLTGQGLTPDAASLAVLARQGDKDAVDVFKDAAEYLARGFSHIINLLNPEAIIIGGGLSLAYDVIGPNLMEFIRPYVVADSLDLDIVVTKLGYNAAVLGAAGLVYAR